MMQLRLAFLVLAMGAAMTGCSSTSDQVKTKSLFLDKTSDPPLGLVERECKLSSEYKSPLVDGAVMGTATLRISAPARRVEDLPKVSGLLQTVGGGIGSLHMPAKSISYDGPNGCSGYVAEMTIAAMTPSQQYPVSIAFDYRDPNGQTKSFKGTILARYGEDEVVTRWGDVTMTITLGG